MIRCLLIFGTFALVSSQGKEYRFDYEFNNQAGGWLKFHMVPATWREARLRCYAEGAVLASPLSNQLKAAIISKVKQHKGSILTTIFTGVHASFSKGDYSSIEGVPLLRLSIVWATGEPNNYDNAESCLAMASDIHGSMSDVKCEEILPYVCYKPDTHLTMSECGTTDPEYHLEARTGSCYKFHKRGQVWHQAYMTCVAEGGYLVIIDTETEMQVVKEYYAKYPFDVIFSSSKHTLAVGFHDWGERVNFMTIHGKPVENDFLRWSKIEPNNLTNARTLDTGEYCGSVLQNVELNDNWCGAAIPFLCEKRPNSLLSL